MSDAAVTFVFGLFIGAVCVFLALVAPRWGDDLSWTCTSRDTASGVCLAQVRAVPE